MAKNEVRNGQAEYGTVHVMEQEMREAGQGVFEPKSGEAGARRARKTETKAEGAKTEKVIASSDGVARTANRAVKGK